MRHTLEPRGRSPEMSLHQRECDWHLSALAGADDLYVYLLPCLVTVQKSLQVTDITDTLSIESNDHIPQLRTAPAGLCRAAQPSAVGGTTRDHFRHDCPAYSPSSGNGIR